MPVEYYRSADPLENLKLRVIVREISRPKNYANGTDDLASKWRQEAFFFSDQVLSWQHKLYSPHELADYIINKGHNRGSAVQIETRSQLSRLERSGHDVKAMLQSRMVYTYIDKDHHEIEDVVVRGRENDIPEKIRRNRAYKTMHICLATDVQVEAIVKESYGRYAKYFTEHVLCSLKIFQDGLVEISPALSKVLRETPAGMPMDISSQYGNTLNPHSSSSVLAMSAFMNDNTVQAALRKGFLLSNLRLKSVQTGSEYEYIVFNLKDVMVPHRLEEIMKKDRMLDMIKASELRGHNAWKQDAPKGDRTVTTYLEIVSANEFPARKLFLTYSMHLPSGWNLRTGNITDGDNMNALANFGYDENARWGGLQGSTHIASAYPSFNSTSRLLSRPLYRGIFYKLSLTSLSRMLLGIAFMLISVASVVLGAVYPFWIIPALVIFFVGSQDLSARRITAVTTQNSSNKGKQLEHEVHSIPEDNIVCFNHLVNLSFDMRDITEKALFSPTADQPIIFFQVYSCGLFHRSILEGCGYFILPNKAGSFEIEIDTWKAVGNLRSRMHEFFVGDHVKLKDEDFPNAIDIASKTLNKFGVLTHSSGSVKFKGQIIVVDPKMAKQNKEEVTQTSGQDSGRKTNRSVADILSTYRSQQSGRKPPLTDFGSKLSNRDSAGAGRPSVKSILEGISATAKASRSNEVLARIRTGRKNQTSSTSNPDESESSPLLASHAASLGETLNSSNSESLGLEERKEILQNAKTFSHRYDGKEADDFEMKQPSASVTPTKAADERKESKSSSPREDGKSPLLEAK